MSDVVLITGGLGYIGGRLAHYLSTQTEWRVRLGTRNPDQELPPELARCGLTHFDLHSPASLDAACQKVRFLIHLAALNEIDSAKNPGRAIEVNTRGTLDLAQSAIRVGVQRVLYFSTAHVYGAPLLGKISELVIPRPVHPYAYTHKAAEDIILAASAEKKFTAIVFRLANGFGPPIRAAVERWTLLVNDLCRQAVTHRRLVLKSAGLQPRNFITLTDVCQATAHFLKLESAALGDGVFNIGGRRSMTILEMTELIASRCEKVLGFPPPIERPAASGPSESQFLDFTIAKAQAAGFLPHDAFEAEIDATLNFCAHAFAPK
jgi:UDP-glucose 4-epimerase